MHLGSISAALSCLVAGDRAYDTLRNKKNRFRTFNCSSFMLRWPWPKIIIFRTGIVYYDLHRDHENNDVPLGKRMTRHVLTVEEILQFPDDYHTKGVLSLPYGDIVEPFEAWYSKTKKMSRIDYYNGKLNCAIFYQFSRDCCHGFNG